MCPAIILKKYQGQILIGILVFIGYYLLVEDDILLLNTWMQRTDSIEKTSMLEKIEAKRSKDGGAEMVR